MMDAGSVTEKYYLDAVQVTVTLGRILAALERIEANTRPAQAEPSTGDMFCLLAPCGGVTVEADERGYQVRQ